jgi:hypothetical protein
MNGLYPNSLTVNSLTANRLSMNSLTVNSLTANRLSMNSLTANQLWLNGIAPNSLSAKMLSMPTQQEIARDMPAESGNPLFNLSKQAITESK